NGLPEIILGGECQLGDTILVKAEVGELIFEKMKLNLAGSPCNKKPSLGWVFFNLMFNVEHHNSFVFLLRRALKHGLKLSSGKIKKISIVIKTVNSSSNYTCG